MSRSVSCRLRPGAWRKWTIAAILSSAALTAAVLPDSFAGAAKSSAKPASAADAPLFEEYGFETGEQAVYGPVTITAWRFRDSTGALAAFQFVRPKDAKTLTSKIDSQAVQTADGAIFEHGNYVLQFAGGVPKDEELAPLYGGLAKLEQSPLPVISTYLPPEGLVANSERYVIGPVSLEKFNSKIPPSIAAFHMSAEAQFGRYHFKNSDMELAIFNYPTPGIARERQEAFQKLPNTLAKRTGPLVAVVTGSSDADAAERLLSKVNYQASITWSERTPTHVAHGLAKMILDIFALAGVIIGFCIMSGLLFAGARILSRRLSGPKGEEGDAMITLHLGGK